MNTFPEVNFLLDEEETLDYSLYILWRGSAVAWACLFPTYLIWGRGRVVQWLRWPWAASSLCLVRDGYGLHIGPVEAIEQALSDSAVQRDTSGQICVSPDLA